MALVMDGPVPLELVRWRLAERFGWTLPEVDAISLGDLHQLIQVDDGRKKAGDVKHGANRRKP